MATEQKIQASGRLLAILSLSVSAACQPNQGNSQGGQTQTSRADALSGPNQPKVSVCLLASQDASRLDALFPPGERPSNFVSERDLASGAATGPENAQDDVQFSAVEAALRLSQATQNQPCTSDALLDFETNLGNMAASPAGSDAAPTSMSLTEEVFHGMLNSTSGNARYGYIRGTGRIVITTGGNSRAYSMTGLSPLLFLRTVRFLLLNG